MQTSRISESAAFVGGNSRHLAKRGLRLSRLRRGLKEDTLVVKRNVNAVARE